MKKLVLAFTAIGFLTTSMAPSAIASYGTGGTIKTGPYYSPCKDKTKPKACGAGYDPLKRPHKPKAPPPK